MMQILKKAILALLIVIGLLTVIKGDYHSYNYNDQYFENSIGTPFESTHSSSRYALIKSIVDRRTIFLSEELAAFSSPDLTKIGDKYISIFTPGVSLLGLPAYLLGQQIGYPQLATFAFFSLISVINIFLVQSVAMLFKATKSAGLVAGLVFVFCTNSLVYSATITQHNVSVSIILATIILCFRPIIAKNTILYALLLALGIIIDIPNILLIAPQTMYYLYRVIAEASPGKGSAKRVGYLIIWLTLGIAPILSVFGIYNYVATGSPYKLGQRLGRAIYPPTQSLESQKIVTASPQYKEKFKQFDTERQIDGYSILLTSKTRGLFRYSPIIFLGILGFISLYKRGTNPILLQIILAIIMLNIILYATFNDPWGGWAFGPRYLIPATALFLIPIAHLITYSGKKIIFGLTFVSLITYSTYINVAGAITSSVVPPSVYTQNLTEKVHSNYKYNFELITDNKSGSLLYNVWLNKYISVSTYHLAVSLAIVVFITLAYLSATFKKYE